MADRMEAASGVIDGVNTLFSVSVPYVPGSLSVWRNGQEILGCFAETDPSAGTFTITDPNHVPISGVWGTDRIVAEFADGVDLTEVVVVDEIAATVADAPFGVDCQVSDVTLIHCTIEDVPVGLVCSVEDVSVIACEVSDVPDGISCLVEDC